MGNGEDVLAIGWDVEGDKRCKVEGDLGITLDVMVYLCMVKLCDIMFIVVLIRLTFELGDGLTGFWVIMPICVWFVVCEIWTIVVTVFAEPMPIQTGDVAWLAVGIRETLACVGCNAMTLEGMWFSKIVMYNKTISPSLIFILASNPRNI